jgi:carboxyl-terminal processing protease
MKSIKFKLTLFRFKILLPVFVLFFLISSFCAFPQGSNSFENDGDIYDKINKNMDIFGKVYKEIALNYVDEIDPDVFVKAGINGMLSTLDPYTVFIDENQKDEIDLITLGKYAGIGITVSLRDSMITITDVMNGYEAQRKGLRIGDKILEVDGTDFTSIELKNVRKYVRGPAGTILMMKIQRNGDVLYFDLTREEIILKNVSYFGFIGDKSEGIAYFKLDRFTTNAENEVVNVLKTLKTQGMINGVILDLRDNAGGLLDAAIGILNKFVDKNSLLLITKSKKKDSEKKYFSKEEPLIQQEMPLVVLVNQNTASASEIVAGAIQDLDRGVVIGSKSFGKGLVQQIKELSSDSKLKMTASRYYTPSGRWIQEKDYFQENKSGVFVNGKPFSQEEFKTLGGRTVYAKGGIMPDIEMDIEPESEIQKSLLDKDMFFKFTDYYLEQYPDIKTFVCTDEVLEQFKDFLVVYNFEYISDADRRLNELKEIALKKEYSENFSAYLDKLLLEVSIEEEREFENAEDELKRSIEFEMNKRIITEREQIEAAFQQDIQLQEAISIIRNRAEYERLLGK